MNDWVLTVVFGVVWGIICGFISKEKENTFSTGFLWGFFLSWIGLIIVLCKKGELQWQSQQSQPHQQYTQQPYQQNSSQPYQPVHNAFAPKDETLRKLIEMCDQGLITATEYEEKRKTILDQL